MVELGLKSGQAYLRPCSINLSAEIALEGPIRMTLALEGQQQRLSRLTHLCFQGPPLGVTLKGPELPMNA